MTSASTRVVSCTEARPHALVDAVDQVGPPSCRRHPGRTCGHRGGSARRAAWSRGRRRRAASHRRGPASSTRSMSFVTVCCREAEDPRRIPPHLPVRAPCPSLLGRRLTACGRKTLWINARARPGRRGRVSRRRSARATCENRCIAEVCHGGQRPASDMRRPMSANAKLRNRCTRWKADGHIIR